MPDCDARLVFSHKLSQYRVIGEMPRLPCRGRYVLTRAKIYQAMKDASKLKLRSGAVVEDVIFETLKEQSQDMLSKTALGWWIIDLVQQAPSIAQPQVIASTFSAFKTARFLPWALHQAPILSSKHPSMSISTQYVAGRSSTRNASIARRVTSALFASHG